MAVEDLRWWTGSEWVSVKDFGPELGDYLPLAGGTMTETAIVDWGGTLSDGAAPGDFSRLRLYDGGAAAVAGMGISTSSFNIGSKGDIDVRIWANGTEHTRHYGVAGFTRQYVDLFFDEQIFGNVQNTPDAPPYSFEGDATTGVYAPAVGVVGITTTGTERLRVRNTGVQIANGTLALGASPSASIGVCNAATLTGTGSLVGTLNYATVEASVTATSIRCVEAGYNNAGTINGDVFQFIARASSTNTGTITGRVIAFRVENLPDSIGSSQCAFWSSISDGIDRWNLFVDGTAPSYFQGQVQCSTGNADEPALSCFGDTDTGVFFNGAGIVGISADGTERVRFSKNGMTIPDNYRNETVGVYGIYSAVNKSPTNAGGTFAFLAGGDAPSQFNGQVLVTSGGAATPGIASRSDPTTGVDIQPGIVSISTAGTERLRVDSAGQITAAAGYTPTADQDLATRKFVEDQVALGGGASVTTADVNLSNPTRSLGRYMPPTGLATQEDANQAIGDAIEERKIVLPISQVDYDALPVKDPDTLYLIVT